MREVPVTVISIQWEGPYGVEELRKFDGAADKGVYQIYGTHAVIGPDALLYIGMTDRTFAQRILFEHRDWIDWEPEATKVFLGRLVGDAPILPSECIELIRRTEALLVYYCSPPYNSQFIKALPNFSSTVLLNFKRHHRLPYVISNLYDLEKIWTYKPYS